MLGPVLKGEKIILRPIAVKEAANYLRWFNDPEVTRYLGTENITKSVKKEQEWIKNTRRDKNKITWAIYTADGIHIGSTGFNTYDRKNGLAIWGIVIGDKNYWNKGIGTEALGLILNYGFKKLKLNRIELLVFTENKAGIKVYERCGFRTEGLKRQAVYRRGKYHDEYLMSVLKTEYNKLKKK